MNLYSSRWAPKLTNSRKISGRPEINSEDSPSQTQLPDGLRQTQFSDSLRQIQLPDSPRLTQLPDSQRQT